MGESTISYSVYAYVLNNPMILVDPTGMSAVEADGLTNEQWVEASRPGNSEMAEEYRKENTEGANNKDRNKRKNTHKDQGESKDNKSSFIKDNYLGDIEDNEVVNSQPVGEFGGPPWYYNGEKYDDKNSLYLAVLWDQTQEQIGIKDAFAVLAIIAGSGTKKKRFVTQGSSKGTSVLSKTLGDKLGRSSSKIPTITNFPPRVTYTKSIGRTVARWVPFVGWSILAYDVYQIYTKTEETYNRIINE